MNDRLKSVLRNNFSSFVQKCFGAVDPNAAYLHNWHLDLIADYLEACRAGDIRKLIINMPPRYMKSIAVTVAFPAWLMGHNPSEKILAASYSSKLSLKHSLDCRMICESQWYRELFPEFKLAPDQNEKSKFMTTARGHRIATSVGGSATGEGGNYLIADDPQNPQEAQSDVKRQKVLDWYDQTWGSRLNDKKKGVQIVVMQRLHEDDLSGHLMIGEDFTHLKIPMIAEGKTIVQFGERIYKVREDGEVLHNARETLEELEPQRKRYGEYGWSGQMQQNPSPSDGGIFKRSWFSYYKPEELPTEWVQKIASADTAFSEKKTADYSTCGTFLICKIDGMERYYLLDVWRGQEAYPTLKQELKNSYSKHKQDLFLIEDKASGQSIIQDLKRHTDIPVRAIKVDTDKISRAYAASPQVEARKLYLPEDAHWINDYINELTTFPMGKNDDMVDMTTQFLNYAKGVGAFEFIIV